MMASIKISELYPIGFDFNELGEREMEAVQGGGWGKGECDFPQFPPIPTPAVPPGTVPGFDFWHKGKGKCRCQY